MAKVKLADYLKKIFGQAMDDEIDLPDPETPEQKAAREKSEKDAKAASEAKAANEKAAADAKAAAAAEAAGGKKQEESMKAIEEGWLTADGKIDESKIKDPTVLAALKLVSEKSTQAVQSKILADAIDAALKTSPARVTKGTLLKSLDLSGIKYEGDKVIGVNEAIEALKKAEPAMFKAKAKTPVEEGFNPLENKQSAVPRSFAEAFQMESTDGE